MVALKSKYLIIKVIFVFISVNVNYVIGQRIAKCEEGVSTKKCFYYPDKVATRKEAIESCKNLSSSLSSENDTTMLAFQGKLGRLWSAYYLDSQKTNESRNPLAENNTPEIACFRQQNLPKILSCKEGNESRNITMKNNYSPEKTCIEFDDKFHYFTSCTEKLHYFCIRMEDKNGKNLESLDEESYNNLTLDCDSLDIDMGGIQFRSLNASYNRISEVVKWSLFKKQMNMKITCFRYTNGPTTLEILPSHVLKFLIKSNLSKSDKSSPEYKGIKNYLFNKSDPIVFNDPTFEDDLKSWKITLTSLNETTLKQTARMILENRNYIPLFCVEETTKYGFNSTVKWDITKSKESQFPNPNICKTQENEIKKRKCMVSESKNDLPKYEWSSFDLEKCNVDNGICPPEYEPVGGSKCIKVITPNNSNNFESHFYNLIGIEDNILDIDIQKSENKNIINFIRFKKYRNVLLPMFKLEEFDRIISISRYAEKEDEIITRNTLRNFKNKYLSYNIDTKKIDFLDNVNESIPYISIINTEELVKSYNGTDSFSESNPTLKKLDSCYECFSHYDGKCIKFLKTDDYKSWREALSQCKNQSLELFEIKYDFLEENYKKMISERKIPSVWMIHNSQLLNEKQLWTQFGKEIIDENAKLRYTACQTKAMDKVSSFNLIMNLTKDMDDKGSYLCLKFSNKNFYFLKNFPVCYCYPDWGIKTIKNSRTTRIFCDYVTDIKYSSKCKCTSVILHTKSTSVIHSNEINFYNRSFNYFAVDITFKNSTLKIEEIEKALRPIKNMSNISITNLNSSTCKSRLHSAKSNENEILSKTYVLHLACNKHVHADNLNIKEIEKLIDSNDEHLSISVIVRPTDGCDLDVINDGERNLTWKKTTGEGYFQPTELCINRHSVPVYRICKENYNEYKWNSFNENCSKYVSDLEKEIHKLKVKNTTDKVNELYEILFNNSNAITPFIIYAVSDILSKTDRSSEYSVSKVINIINNILESPVSNITFINTASNVASKLLTSFDELLISHVPFNFTTMQERANNNEQIVVFGGSISKVDNKLKAAFEIINKENKYTISFLQSVENEINSPDVIISIPKSLRECCSQISYIHKQWKNKLFFQDPSLKERGLEVVGDIIDVNFVNSKTKMKQKIINDTIIIKMKVNSSYENKQFVCAYWNLDNKSWSTDGCSYSPTKSSGNYVSCTCNHMTHFGFLFYVSNRSYVLNIIVYLGSSVSIFFMFIVIISGFILKTWPTFEDTDANTLINICIATSGTTLSVIIGAGQTKNIISCDIFAAALHYFLLSSFFWMSTEAIFKYQKYVKGVRFVDYKLYKLALLVSWGIPLVIGIILWSSRFLTDLHLQKKETCWLLKNEMYFYFLLPLCLFLTLNLFIYFYIIYKFGNGLLNTIGSNIPITRTIKREICEVFTLGFVFGLTWLFGLFLMTGNKTFTILIDYIFSILQSLQGTFIFLRVYGNKPFRDGWKHLKFRCCN